MRNFLFLSLAFLAMALAQPARANFFVEPYLAYESGELDPGGSSEKIDFAGLGYGLRIGYGVMGFKFGAEYGSGSLTGENDAGTEYTIKPADLGLYVGYEFPVMFKLWLVYGFSVKGTLEDDAGGSSDLDEGSATKIGAAYTGLPFVDIGVEMVNRGWDKADDSDVDFSYSAYSLILALSLP